MHRRIAVPAAALAILIACMAAFVLYFLRDQETTPAFVYGPSLSALSDTLSADAWGVFDPETGTILEGHDIDEVHPIASITKLFTAAAVVSSADKDAVITVTAADVAAEGRAGRLRIGDTTTPYMLLFPLLIESSNDAAYAIKRALGESFADRTQELTSAAGLMRTEIKEASGLDPHNVSTVADLAAYFAYMRRTEPHIIDITKLRTYVTPYTEYHNNNPARVLSSFRGGKHGYIEEAGRTFVGTFNVNGTDAEVGIVLLNSSDLIGDMESLARFGNALVASGILKHTGSAL